MKASSFVALLGVYSCAGPAPVPCWMHLQVGYGAGYVTKSNLDEPPWHEAAPCDDPGCQDQGEPVCSDGTTFRTLCAFERAAGADARMTVQYHEGACR